MEEVSMNSQMAAYMMDNGKIINFMEKAFILIEKEINGRYFLFTLF